MKTTTNDSNGRGGIVPHYDTAEQIAEAFGGAFTAFDIFGCTIAINQLIEDEKRAAQATLLALQERLLAVARGCLDYGGGYRSDDGKLEAFHHGIQTVINALEAAAKNDPNDTQVNVLIRVGRTSHRAPTQPKKEGAMSTINDGGPAFPHHETTSTGEPYHDHLGMSLRDWFAGQALVGRETIHGITYSSDVAEACYALADAMLVARTKEPTP